MRRVTNLLGHGIDVVKTSRFESMIRKHGSDTVDLKSGFVSRFSRRILNSTHELPTFQQLTETNDLPATVRFLAGNWAMKEAIYKTLDPEDQQSFQFNDWYKIYDERGKPEISSENYPKTDEEFAVSLTHDNDVLIASVIRQQVMYITY